ncbi:SCO-spondin isoform X2 [Cuculus canorus]|uniref:SCO-spondin isoform X2 n=1 Tax=Cuculus canorus TaxID=55661 RepID=UPI0023AA4D08|nr:SCO-spondin isoform X2 [Cuculus canorus]
MLSFPSAPLSGPLTAVGCVVGSWGPWSRCSSPCGVGSKARSRQVTIPPWHGGEPCPDLKQRRGCLGEHPTCGAAKGNTSPMGIPRPSCMSIPAAHPKVSVTIPVPYPGCSAARGGQGIAQLLWPGLQGSLVESQAAAAGGAIWLLRLFPPDAGRAPLPRAGLDPLAAPRQAGLRRMLGRRSPPPLPLHWTWAARSQPVQNSNHGSVSPGPASHF